MFASVISFGRAALVAAIAFVAAPAAAQEAAVRETHGDWEIRCTSDELCFMIQVGNDAEDRAVVSFAIRELDEPRIVDGRTFVAQAELRTRLGVYLPGGIVFTVDESESLRFPFERCVDEGCSALPLVQQGLIDRLKAGARVEITVFANRDQPVNADISLVGFTAAYDAL